MSAGDAVHRPAPMRWHDWSGFAALGAIVATPAALALGHGVAAAGSLAAAVTNVTAKQGDARALPFADGTFDAAYLVGVLGEIPDARAALRELRRVLKPGGRLVVGEVIFDPDFVPFGTLERRASDADFVAERKAGGALSYLARFRPADRR